MVHSGDADGFGIGQAGFGNLTECGYGSCSFGFGSFPVAGFGSLVSDFSSLDSSFLDAASSFAYLA